MVQLLLLVRRRPVVCLMSAALAAGAAVAAWVLAHRETFMPVSGTVSVDGKLFQSGIVTFYPNHGRGNPYLGSAWGEIKDGKYELRTYDENGRERRGVPPGWYRVVVRGYAASDRSAAAKPSPRVVTITPSGAAAKPFPKGAVPNGVVVADQVVVTDHVSSDQTDIIAAVPPPGDPKDFFSNHNKPQAVEVINPGPQGAYDLALTRSGKHQRRQ